MSGGPGARSELLSASAVRRPALPMEVGIRHHRVVVDESPRYGGHDKGPNPVELLLGGLATASLVIIEILAGGDLAVALRLDIEARLNVERILGAPTTDPMFTTLRLEWTVPDEQAARRVESLLPELARRRPGQALIDTAGAWSETVTVARTDDQAHPTSS